MCHCCFSSGTAAHLLANEIIERQPAVLPGHALYGRTSPYPIAVPRSGGEVVGEAVRIRDEEVGAVLAALDEYEGDEYVRVVADLAIDGHHRRRIRVGGETTRAIRRKGTDPLRGLVRSWVGRTCDNALMTDRADCEAADQADPLAALRQRFTLPEGVIYLDGNSLGALPINVPARVGATVVEEWGRDLITSWNRHGWAELPHRVGDKIARIIGTEPGTIVASDSTTVNLFKVVSAALELTDRTVVLSDSGNFPTDLYAMSSLAELRVVAHDEIPAAITPDVGVVALTHVGYSTGRMHDMAAVTEAAHRAGALMVWDLAHSAGAMDLELGDADFAIGCGYKYLNGGPGAPAFVYVRPDRQAEFHNPIRGWFGHAAPFEFALDFAPVDGVARAGVGTPHILSLVALDAALDVFDGVDLAAVRSKSVALTDLFGDLVDGLGIPIVSPREALRRGSQVCLSHSDGYAIVQALIARGVIGDFRVPDVLRFGFAPLYIRFVDVFDAVTVLAEVLDSGAFNEPRHSVRNPVT